MPAPLPAIGAKDLAYISGHPHAIVRAQKPRLHMIKQNQKKGLPVCTVAPAITGTVAVGQLLTCSAGTWLNSPTMAYLWRRKGVGYIPGGTGSTYTPVAGDHGYQIECEVTAANGAGSTATRSNAVSP